MINNLIKKYQTFIRYIFSAGISFAIDLSLFTVFSAILKNYISDQAIFLATILARIISSLINYFLNRNTVFKMDQKNFDFTTLIKYYLLVIIQMLVSATVVYKLYQLLHINETLIKIPVEVVLFMMNYIIQKLFIFKDHQINISIKYQPYIAFILSTITTFSLLFQTTSTKLSFHRSNTMMITYIVLDILLYIYYKKYLFKFKKRGTYTVIAIIFSLLLVFGYSYDTVHNANLVFGNIGLIMFSLLKILGLFCLFNTTILLLDDYLKHKELKTIKYPKLFSLFEKHPFIFSFIFILICYIPYIVAYYPVIINYDAANQIKEIMGIHTRYMDSVVLLNPNMYITNFKVVYLN